MKKEIKRIEISITYNLDQPPEHYYFNTVNDAMEALFHLDLDLYYHYKL